MKFKINSFLVMIFLSSNLYAKSLELAARGMEKKMSDLALLLAPLGLVLGGIYLLMGRDDAKAKISLAVGGIICILGAKPFIEWMKGIL